jgi:hypothetical protein
MGPWTDRQHSSFSPLKTYSEGEGGDEGADEALPHCAIRKHLVHLPWGRQRCHHITELSLTSIENSTPPMGEPKATATPAALDAVTISLIFTIKFVRLVPYIRGRN